MNNAYTNIYRSFIVCSLLFLPEYYTIIKVNPRENTGSSQHSLKNGQKYQCTTDNFWSLNHLPLRNMCKVLTESRAEFILLHFKKDVKVNFSQTKVTEKKKKKTTTLKFNNHTALEIS